MVKLCSIRKENVHYVPYLRPKIVLDSVYPRFWVKSSKELYKHVFGLCLQDLLLLLSVDFQTMQDSNQGQYAATDSSNKQPSHTPSIYCAVSSKAEKKVRQVSHAVMRYKYLPSPYPKGKFLLMSTPWHLESEGGGRLFFLHSLCINRGSKFVKKV